MIHLIPLASFILTFLFVLLSPVLSASQQNFTSCRTFNAADNNNEFVLLSGVFCSDPSCIVVEDATNITLVGNGNTVECLATTCGVGIYVNNCYGITVMNFSLEGWSNGINFFSSVNVKVVNNTFSNKNRLPSYNPNYFGIGMDADNFLVQDNWLRDMSQNAIPEGEIAGIYATGHGVVMNNIISNFQTLCIDWIWLAGIYLDNCPGCIVEGNIIVNINPNDCTDVTATIYGILASSADSSQVHNNFIDGITGSLSGVGELHGIALYDSNSVIAEYNTITNVYDTSYDPSGYSHGFSLFGSAFCSFNFNTISIVGPGYFFAFFVWSENMTFANGTITDLTSGSAQVYSFVVYKGKNLLVQNTTVMTKSAPATAWCFSKSYNIVVGLDDCNEFVLSPGRTNFVCRPVSGDCDVAEYYSSSDTCAPDGFKNNSVVCQNYTMCDVPDYCSGKSTTCTSKYDSLWERCCDNGICDINEDCSICYADCKDLNCNVPGDLVCGQSENCSTSFSDCNCTADLACGGTPPCGGHGNCIGGVCHCSGYWAGATCIAKTINITVIQSVDHPSIEIYSKNNPNATEHTTIYVSKIAELSSSNNVERAFDFASLKFSVVNDRKNGVDTWTYAQQLFSTANNQAVVRVTISYFNESSSFFFANQSISVPPQTVKFSIRVENWSFLTPWNFLQIELKAVGYFTRDKENNFITEQQEISGNLIWKTVSSDYYKLYIRVHDVALLDDRPQIVQFTSKPNSTDIFIKIPHFWHFVEIDPDFSALPPLEFPIDDPIKDEQFSTTIAIVIAVCGAILITSGVVLRHFYLKKRIQRQVDLELDGRQDKNLRILFAESNPPGTMPTFSTMAMREMQAIVPAYLAPAATWETLQQQVAEVKPVILHIWAHGDRDGDSFGIILSDNDRLPLEVQRTMENFRIVPQQIAQLVKSSGIECVLFSVCHSAAFVEEAYLQSMCNCVGFEGTVNPRYMARWCEGFYQGILEKKIFHECVEDGLRFLEQHPVRNNENTEAEEYIKFKDALVVRPLQV